MAVKPPTKHIAVYAAVALGLLGFGAYTLKVSNVMPPGLQGRQLFFIDMMDSDYVRSYEAEMRPMPDGAVAQNWVAVEQGPIADGAGRADPSTDALTNPYPVDDKSLEKGKWGFNTYCAPCHGPDGLGGGAVADNSNGKKRYPIPPPVIQGDAGVAKLRSDGYLYMTIRRGGAIMPAYNWAMTDQEMWAVVSYIRTLPGTTYTPPAPPAGT